MVEGSVIQGFRFRGSGVKAWSRGNLTNLVRSAFWTSV